ncbi:Dynein light chain [Paragonimus heterotremus]|uniref:Dynein light chain n=1 Tax=Paragonimus heterotremus TaxID=100268 RepID=A0A8J4X388_9TREM|nr:Dynein light chain [Paragonimus heterotremus]
MEPFLNIYFCIDKDESGIITIKELDDYVNSHNLDPMMVTQWKTLFDPENTGEISLEKYCEVFGLHPAQVVDKREAHKQQSSVRLGEDIHVIYQNMPIADQVLISDETRAQVKQRLSDSNIREMTEELKRVLDKQLGPSWQVAVVDGSYWITHTYLPGTSFQFLMGERAYLF